MTDLVKMRVGDIRTCSLVNWYKKFEKRTIKSLVLPMPPEVEAYMQDKGTLVLPKGTEPEPIYNVNRDDDEEDNWDFCESSEEEEAPVAKAPDLEEFNKKIGEAIEELGGKVFPKLNWSSPSDASWISVNRSLRCTTPGDIYLLLKSSVFATHDLTTPFRDCADIDEVDITVDYCLVLRKWMEINPAHEFRGFVKDKELVGISQRDITQGFACVVADYANIRSDIISYFHEVIENKFPLDNYTFDVYRPDKDQMILVDFAPLGVATNPYLFDWHEFKVLEKRQVPSYQKPKDPSYEELCEDIMGLNVRPPWYRDTNRSGTSPLSSEDKPDFRYIPGTVGVQPHPFCHFGLPVDVYDLSTGADPQKLIDFLQQTHETHQRHLPTDEILSDDDGGPLIKS